MPGDGCLNTPALIAVVTKIWSPHTIGDDHARPGISAAHATLIVVDHFVGSVATGETARPDGPRNCGQVLSGAGAGTSVVTKSTTRESSWGTAESYMTMSRALLISGSGGSSALPASPARSDRGR